jgi:hypothetical protein
MKTFFVIFSLSRSGSTALHRSLNLHPDIACACEPALGPPEQSTQELVSRLTVLRGVYSGIKHLWDPSGFPFVSDHISQVPAMERHRERWLQLNKVVLTQPQQRVIFLQRRNVLRRIVSDLIGQQTEEWGPHEDGPISGTDGADYRSRLSVVRLRPIDLDVVRWYLIHERAMMQEFRSAVLQADIPCYDLTYEDLFERSSQPEQRRDAINAIVDFLGYSPMPESVSERIDILLDPRHGKLNSDNTYRLIPNVEGIERTCGNDETGWLF